jgi:hypothetical protein
MQKKYVPLLIALLVLVTTACLCTGTGLGTPTEAPAATSVPQQPTTAPEQPANSANPSGLITEVVMAKDVAGDTLDPVDPTTVFGPSSVIHAVAKIQDAPANTKFTASFYVQDVGSAADPGQLIGSYDITADGTRNLDFNLSPASTWPAGTYRVEISVNDVVDQIVEYSVQ